MSEESEVGGAQAMEPEYRDAWVKMIGDDRG
jgi:hypothetical protein